MTKPPAAVNQRRSLASIAVAAGIALVLIYAVVIQGRRGYDTLKFHYQYPGPPKVVLSDFPMFYGGAALAGSDDRRDLYKPDTIVREILIAQGFPAESVRNAPVDPNSESNHWLRYYNPPFFLLLLSPLTLLDVRTAYLVAIGANVALLVVLAIAMGYILRWRQPETALLALALAGASPVYYTLDHGQPTILLAILLATAYLALRHGHDRLGGLLFVLMGLKPDWLIPGASLLKQRPRLFLPLLVGGIVVLLLPFLIVGPGALVDYVHLVTGRGQSDLNDQRYATALLSWAGLFPALLGKPSPLLWFLASAGTLAIFYRVWRRDHLELTLASVTLASLLVIPHSHPQDWVLIAPVAALVLSLDWDARARAGIIAGLLALFLGANDWHRAYVAVAGGGSAIYWVTLAGFGLLAWLAYCVERRLPLTMASTPSEAVSERINP